MREQKDATKEKRKGKREGKREREGKRQVDGRPILGGGRFVQIYLASLLETGVAPVSSKR